MILETTDAANRGPAQASMLEGPRPSRALRALQAAAVRVGGSQVANGSDASPRTVDVEELTRRFRGRREVVRKILCLFGEECRRLVDELRQSIDQADLAGATAAAHRLKGAAGTAAAGSVADAAGRIEEGCRLGRPEEVIAGFADLEREARRAIDQITGELARDEVTLADNDVIERS